MKVIQVTKYQCSYCGHVFDFGFECRDHEKEDHICRSCMHSYYAYGCEFRCAREEAGKKCRYKKEDKK